MILLLILMNEITQYNTLNLELSKTQLNNLKSWIKQGTEVTLNLSPVLVGNSNGGTIFPQKWWN